MKYFWLLLLTTSCQYLGGDNTADRVAELLSASEDPDSPNAEVVCIRGSIAGTFTQTNIAYVKKVYPKGEPAPEC